MKPPFEPWQFPLFFAGMWLFVTTVLGALSGWFHLMSRYPDRPQKALAEFQELSGSMGLGVNMSRVLRLSPCPGGLRVGMSRFLGPFCRDFFVPWEDVAVTREAGFLGRTAVLRFRGVAFGRLVLDAHLADALWRAAPQRWPESGPSPAKETKEAAFQDLFRKWAVTSLVVVGFFSLIPRAMDARLRRHPPSGFNGGVFVFFPVAIAVAYAYEYWRRTKD